MPIVKATGRGVFVDSVEDSDDFADVGDDEDDSLSLEHADAAINESDNEKPTNARRPRKVGRCDMGRRLLHCHRRLERCLRHHLPSAIVIAAPGR
jgi:hypothetical protein